MGWKRKQLATDSLGPLNIVLHGNSLFNGVAEDLEVLRPGTDVVTGVVVLSATTQALTDNFEDEVHDLFDAGRTNLVVLWELIDHINDDGGTAATAHADYAEYVAQAQSFGWLVMVCTCIDTGEYDADSPHVPRGDLQPERHGANVLIRADKAGAEYLCDLEADPMFSMATDAASNTTNYSGDEIHINEPGQERVAELIDEAIP